MQGLYTADYFIEDGTSYFERVLGSMNDDAARLRQPRLRVLLRGSPSQRREGLRRTFEEVFRVLKPGGRLLIVNETLKTGAIPIGVHAEGVEQFEGYEHAHWASHIAGRRSGPASPPGCSSRAITLLQPADGGPSRR